MVGDTARATHEAEEPEDPPRVLVRLLIAIDVFRRSGGVKHMHEYLIVTDIALGFVYLLSSGGIHVLEPVFTALIAAHVFVYLPMVQLLVLPRKYSGVNSFLPTDVCEYRVVEHHRLGIKGKVPPARKCAKWVIVTLAVPLVLSDMQSRLVEQAPSTVGLVETITPAVPVIQSYIMTLLTILILLQVFALGCVTLFYLRGSDGYKRRVSNW